MKDLLLHLFIPSESNNHRAKILHHTNLFLTIAILVLASFLIQNLSKTFPSVLGISTNITPDSLLWLTNSKRAESGVNSLTLNSKLSKAATQKADDMFAQNYWAHNAPDGKTPWVFIKNSGYNYIYAGENLARGFTTAEDAINAWMASPTHRANMLSSNYRDVGFAVKIGTLNGEETVLIVEEFGNESLPLVAQRPIEVETSSAQEEALSENSKRPVINSLSLSSNVNKTILSVFILSLAIDMIVVTRKKIIRFVGHNIDHIFYLLLIFLLIGILTKGVVV